MKIIGDEKRSGGEKIFIAGARNDLNLNSSTKRKKGNPKQYAKLRNSTMGSVELKLWDGEIKENFLQTGKKCTIKRKN